MIASVLLDFNLPNATTWFYFSLLLSVALFFKFGRVLSVRNLDVLTLFALVPPLIVLQDGRSVGGAGAGLWWAYLWLLAGSAWFFARCVCDLALVRRPALAPNLNLSGLAWLGGALFVCLLAVAVRRPVDSGDGKVGRSPVALNEVQNQATELVRRFTFGPADPADRPAAARFWAERGLAVLCHLAVAVGLILVGWRHFGDASAGMAAATFYLLLPYTAIFMPQAHHVAPAALVLWAVFAYRSPSRAGLLLGLASGSFFFPALLLPVWLGFYRGRGLGRFLLSFGLAAGASLGLAGLILWLDGTLSANLQLTLSLPEWQPWRAAKLEGVWTGVFWAYRLPVFVLYMAFVIVTFFWPRPRNLAQVIALSAACLIGIQFWYSDRGGVYVLWYLPLLLLLVFRPNLSDKLPPPLDVAADWAGRVRDRVAAAGGALVPRPETFTGRA